MIFKRLLYTVIITLFLFVEVHSQSENSRCERETKNVSGFELLPAYPNPFNLTTVIRFIIYEDGFVNLTVYNLIGQKILILVNEKREAGYYSESFNATGLASGVYVYQIIFNGKQIKSAKLLLLK